MLQHAAKRCNTLQHAATRCNTLQRAATCCNTLQNAASRCNMLQHAATRCNALQHAATPADLGTSLPPPPLQHAATHCNTLQQVAGHGTSLSPPEFHGVSHRAYGVVLAHRNWQIETAGWNWAGFFTEGLETCGQRFGQFLK